MVKAMHAEPLCYERGQARGLDLAITSAMFDYA